VATFGPDTSVVHLDNTPQDDLSLQERLAGVRALVGLSDASKSLQRPPRPTLWVGHPKPEEVLPPELTIALPKRDHRWVWIAYVGGDAKAVIYAADFHGIVFLSAVRSMPQTPASVILKLFREIARSCRRRGFTHFLVFLGTGTAAELKLLRIMQRMSDTKFEAASGVWASAGIPSAKGWK
jgi:hypothetical protein